MKLPPATCLCSFLSFYILTSSVQNEAYKLKQNRAYKIPNAEKHRKFIYSFFSGLVTRTGSKSPVAPLEVLASSLIVQVVATITLSKPFQSYAVRSVATVATSSKGDRPTVILVAPPTSPARGRGRGLDRSWSCPSSPT